MVQIDDIQESIREHLLGRVKGEEREHFEEKFWADPEFREVVLLIEGELFDDYVADSLSDADRESFIQQYVKAPTRKRDVQFTAALRDHAIQAARPRPQHSENSLLNVFTNKRWMPLLVTGTLVVAVLVIFWTGLASWIWRDRTANFSAEVALLNKQSAGNQPSFPIPLQFIQNRSTGDQQKVSIPSGTSVVELQSPLPNTSYHSYQATLQVVNDGVVFSVDQLPAETARDGKTLRLRIPARVLTPQDYIFSVKGLTAEGRLEDVADYFFRIVK